MPPSSGTAPAVRADRVPPSPSDTPRVLGPGRPFPGPAGTPSATAAGLELPTADLAVAHTLLNCLLREGVATTCGSPGLSSDACSGGEGRLLLRLPHTGTLLRVALRRTSVLGAHRFRGPVCERTARGWAEIESDRLAERIRTELTLRTGASNDEFPEQVASSRTGVAAALDSRRSGGRHHAPAGAPLLGSGPLAAYLASEQSLVFGHRFHPTPKARSGDPASWTAYAPEAAAVFPLRLLAVREQLSVQETAEPGAAAPLDRLGRAPEGYRLLPVHPWQYEMLRGHPSLRAALDRRDVLDLGRGSREFTATASVRTLYDGETFLKFSLNVRITNCLRKNADYELAGAVALTRLLAPAFDELASRFPGSDTLREPAYRSLALPGPDGRPETALLEGLGVIVREGLAARTASGSTPLLAAALADEYPTSPAQVSRLLTGAGSTEVLRWWRRYLALLVPPVLAAYFDHGVVLEPHLQNVLVCVDAGGSPVKVLFRDLEGTKLLGERHATTLAGLPPRVAGPLTYDAARGWDRLVYCLVVNHLAELLAALADLHPGTERALWAEVRQALRMYADTYGSSPRLDALLAGAALPAKANLLTRWGRRADREAGYVRLPSPFAVATTGAATGAATGGLGVGMAAGATRDRDESGDRR